MVSQQIKLMLERAAKHCQSETQRAALEDLSDTIGEASKTNCCIRCQKAGHMIYFDSEGRDVKQHRWVISQTKCSDFRSLPLNANLEFGFSFPWTWKNIVCDGEAGDDALPNSSQAFLPQIAPAPGPGAKESELIQRPRAGREV